MRLALGVALVLPTAAALAYYVLLPGPGAEPSAALQTAYVASKLVQFALPLGCVLLLEGRLEWPGRPAAADLLLGAGLGLLVAVGMLALYFGLLRGTALFAPTASRLRRELTQMGLASVGGFALLATTITLVHSLLEEYYWRWFAFGRLRRVARPATALVLSSLAFMLYHMVLLAEFFPGGAGFVLAGLPFGLCTGVGAALWAWLYQRSGSIVVPWLCHLIVDAALFVVGYDLYFLQPASPS